MKPAFLKRLLVILVPVALLSLSSCRVLNPSIMLETDKKFVFDTLHLDSSQFSSEYRLAPDDMIEFRLFANDGFKMVDLISTGVGQNTNNLNRQGYQYIIDSRGYVKLPVLGLVRLDSLTIREAETHLEERYSTYYVKPFVLLSVLSRRVVVFPGGPGEAKVIQLINGNTTVFEALAQAGGISSNGKAHKISLIRQSEDPAKPHVYRLDLSDIRNVEQGNIVVQSNDVIYVEPRKRYASRTLQEVTPILSLLSAAFSVYVLLNRI
jgi:polysaccharide biosynthesis/export protein